MVTIKKDQTVLIVTQGAFRNYFQDMGYEVVDDAQRPKNSGWYNSHPELGTPETEASEASEADLEEEDENLSEIPLNEMSFAQLHARAGQLGIAHENMHSKKELRAAIRSAQ